MTDNILVLAYIGDAIYELYIRKYLISKNIVKVDTLQKESIKYISAKSQSSFLSKLIQNNFFDEKEMDIIKRGVKNARNKTRPICLRALWC